MNPSAEPEKSDFALLLQFDMSMDGFASDWAYCDRLSSYVARMIGHNRRDSLLYSNLFSSALNELVETAFRAHRPGGDLVCSIWRCGARDRIELRIPCDPALARFYRTTADILAGPDTGERYRQALFSDGPLPVNIGLLELAVDYKAGISVDAAGDDAIVLRAELSLEEAEA